MKTCALVGWCFLGNCWHGLRDFRPIGGAGEDFLDEVLLLRGSNTATVKDTGQNLTVSCRADVVLDRKSIPRDPFLISGVVCIILDYAE